MASNLKDISVSALAKGFRSDVLIGSVLGAASVQDRAADEDRQDAYERLVARRALPPVRSVRADAIERFSFTTAETHEFDRLRWVYRYSVEDAAGIILRSRRPVVTGEGG